MKTRFSCALFNFFVIFIVLDTSVKWINVSAKFYTHGSMKTFEKLEKLYLLQKNDTLAKCLLHSTTQQNNFMIQENSIFVLAFFLEISQRTCSVAKRDYLFYISKLHLIFKKL